VAGPWVRALLADAVLGVDAATDGDVDGTEVGAAAGTFDVTGAMGAADVVVLDGTEVMTSVDGELGLPAMRAPPMRPTSTTAR